MTAPAIAISVCALLALAALVLSVGSSGRLSRSAAIASLWLALAAVPSSLAWDLFVSPPEATAAAKATRLGTTISHAMNYGVVVMPFAGIAMFALRRAAAKSVQGRKRSK